MFVEEVVSSNLVKWVFIKILNTTSLTFWG